MMDEIQEFVKRLAGASPQARKLLLNIHELAYHGRGQARSAGAAYLPELYESCGLDPDEMYPKLKELVAVKAIELEGEYPFEDVRVTRSTQGEDMMAVVEEKCKAADVKLRDVVVELQMQKLK